MNVEQFNEKLDNINESIDKFDEVSSDVLDKVVVDPSIWLFKKVMIVLIPFVIFALPPIMNMADEDGVDIRDAADLVVYIGDKVGV